MTITQLKYLLALDKFRNFAQAAEHCYVAQPTLSLQLKKLEQQVGVALFDRSKTPLVPTPEGERFIAQARNVLGEVERLEALFQEEKKSPEGDLRVGIIPTISCYLLPQLLPALQKKYPKLNLMVQEITTAQIVERLESNRIDVGVLATPLNLRNIAERPLYYEPFVVYFSPGVRPKRKRVEIDDLDDYQLILLGDEHCFRGQMLKICSRSARGQIECSSLETVKRLVDQGLGISLFPELCDIVDAGGTLRFKDPQPCRAVGLVTRKQFFKTRLLDALRQTLEALVPEGYRSAKNRKIIGVDADI